MDPQGRMFRSAEWGPHHVATPGLKGSPSSYKYAVCHSAIKRTPKSFSCSQSQNADVCINSKGHVEALGRFKLFIHSSQIG